LTAVVTAILTLLLAEPLKALLKKLGQGIEQGFQRLAPRRTGAYLRALGEEHQWLKLIGVSNRVDLHPPRLREVYVSLRLAASRAEEATRLGWEQILSREEGGRRVVFLGSPGAGKSTLLDYLVLVFTGVIRHPLRRGWASRCRSSGASASWAPRRTCRPCSPVRGRWRCRSIWSSASYGAATVWCCSTASTR
jgi:hypothetical protein